MTQITVTINDNAIKGLPRKFTIAMQKLPAKVVRPEIVAAKNQASGNYPRGSFTGYTITPPFNTRYKRTGRYGRSFKILRTGGRGLGYTLVSNARRKGRAYSRFVGGRADGTGQATIHKRAGGWPLIVETLEAAAVRIKEIARKFFAKELTEKGGGVL